MALFYPTTVNQIISSVVKIIFEKVISNRIYIYIYIYIYFGIYSELLHSNNITFGIPLTIKKDTRNNVIFENECQLFAWTQDDYLQITI